MNAFDQRSLDHSAAPGRFERLLQVFEPISLAEMGKATLLRRTDTKFIMREDQLAHALQQLVGHYRVLDIDGRRLHSYQTLYFDTPDLALYRQHHDGWRSRYKVRFRTYADSRQSFLEVKRKTNQNVTVKSRIKTPGMTTHVTPYADGFLTTHFPFPTTGLEPSLWNTFYRITLVSVHSIERLTLDIGVREWSGQAQTTLDGIAIAEVKQDGFSMNSDFIHQMRALGIRSSGFSKYCIGISLLYDGIKRNRFKGQLLQVDQLIQGRTH